jgi:hypothetical protein
MSVLTSSEVQQQIIRLGMVPAAPAPPTGLQAYIDAGRTPSRAGGDRIAQRRAPKKPARCPRGGSSARFCVTRIN